MVPKIRGAREHPLNKDEAGVMVRDAATEQQVKKIGARNLTGRDSQDDPQGDKHKAGELAGMNADERRCL